MNRLPKNISCNNKGFTLIEVLIAVIILSIGLLGMAGIQIKGLRGTTSSTVRSQATILANDIAERMHVNTNGVFITGANANSHYANVNTNNITCGEDNAPNFCSASPGNADVEPCITPKEMAEFDIYEFACGLGHNAGIKNLLPSGNATISCNDMDNNCPPGSEITININWTELRPSDGEQMNKTVTMVVVP